MKPWHRARICRGVLRIEELRAVEELQEGAVLRPTAQQGPAAFDVGPGPLCRASCAVVDEHPQLGRDSAREGQEECSWHR